MRLECWAAVSAVILMAGGAVWAQDGTPPEKDIPGSVSLESEGEPAEGEASVGPTTPEPPGSVVESIFTDLSEGNVKARLDSLYAPNVVYEGPLGRIEGRERLGERMKGLLGSLSSFAMDVREVFVSGDETVALWTATISNKHLKSGEPLVVDGVTHVRVEGGKVVSHRDYYDLGGAVYENVAVIGWLVRWVKGKI